MAECLISIYEEILVKVLRGLPTKSLHRFKCVSKKWCKLISDRSLMIPSTTTAGLVFYCMQPADPFSKVFLRPCLQTHLRLDNEGGASVDHSINYKMKSNLIILDSCNGFLLLCQIFTKSHENIKEKYIVYNPTTKWLERLLPPIHLSSPLAGLVFDGNHFKVVFFCESSDGSSLVFQVYSSKNKKWIKKAFDSPLGCPFDFPMLCFVKSLFFKGAMHWPWEEHLLLYHLQGEFYKVIKLPRANTSNDMDEWGSCIWQFEGRLHYCQILGNEINIWALHMEEHSYVSGLQHFVLQQMHSGVLAAPPNSIAESPYCFSPFAFNEDFKILYIRCNEYVISYIPESRTQKVSYTCLQKTEGCVPSHHRGCPFSYISD